MAGGGVEAVINLDRRDLRTRYFLWCLRHPMCRASRYDAEGHDLGLKPVEWYVENGTTLCHFFWCCLWVPLLMAALISAIAFLVIGIHVGAYQEYGAPGLLIPAGTLIGGISVVALIILAFIGAGKVGLLPYLAALKAKICPRITFAKETPHAS